mgnify:CR=1 FL=1
MRKLLLLSVVLVLLAPAAASADSRFEFGNDCRDTLIWAVDGEGASYMGGSKLGYRQDAAIVVSFTKEDGSPDPDADPAEVIFHAAPASSPSQSAKQLEFRVSPKAPMTKQIIFEGGKGVDACRFRVVK